MISYRLTCGYLWFYLNVLLWKIDNPIANVLQAKMEGFYFQWCQDILHC